MTKGRVLIKKFGLELRTSEDAEPMAIEKPYNFPLGHDYIRPRATLSPWLIDPEFQRVWKIVEPMTHFISPVSGYDSVTMDIYRAWQLYDLAQKTDALPGEPIEVGVFCGASACVIAAALAAVRSKKKVHLFDTFEGVVKAGDQDTFYKGGEHLAEVEKVANLAKAVCVERQILIFPGIYPDETGNQAPTQINFAHLDVDTYGSVRDAFPHAWQRLAPGCVLIVDDYPFEGCEGVKKFFDELNLPDGRMIHNLAGHLQIVKFG